MYDYCFRKRGMRRWLDLGLFQPGVEIDEGPLGTPYVCAQVTLSEVAR
jgi:hypothetical protein